MTDWVLLKELVHKYGNAMLMDNDYDAVDYEAEILAEFDRLTEVTG